MAFYQTVSSHRSKYAHRFRSRVTKLIRLVARKRVGLVHRNVQALELLVKERRVLVEELKRNCWASCEAEDALKDAETSLVVRKMRLDRLLRMHS